MTAIHDPTPTDPIGLSLLTADQWEFLVGKINTEVEYIDLGVPRIAASGPNWFSTTEWGETQITRTFAEVQLTRRDRTDIGELLYRHFRIGKDEFRILRVLEREGHCAVVRCQMRPVAELRPPTVKRLPDGAQVIEPSSHTLLVPARQQQELSDAEIDRFMQDWRDANPDAESWLTEQQERDLARALVARFGNHLAANLQDSEG